MTYKRRTSYKEPELVMNVAITFSTSTKEAERLNKMAEDTNVSRSELIRRLIQDGLGKDGD